MSQLPVNTLFSPSLARAHVATAKDWNYVDAWLLKHLSKPPPPFERNAETLKAFLALAAHSEAAEEEHALIARVEQKALQELKTIAQNEPDMDLLEKIQDNLSREGQAALQMIAEASVLLNQPVPNLERMGSKIVDLQTRIYGLEQAEDRILVLERYLGDELQKIEKVVSELQGEAYQAPPDLARETNQYQRKTKALSAKLPELKDRLQSLQAATQTPITIEEVKTLEDQYKGMTITARDLESQVKSFHGLPQDTDLARLELESLRVELHDLTAERDTMFEGLVERESPKKVR